MSLFDLLFLASVLALLLSLAGVAYLLLNRQPILGAVKGIGLGIGVYLAALLTASATTPARVYAPGERKCSDDWCLAVTASERAGDLVQVRITVSSVARRVTQRERGVSLSLVDAQNRRYQPVAESGPALDTAIGPGEQFEVTRAFRPAPDAKGLALTVTHSQGPVSLVIADEGSLFHRRSRMELPLR